MKLTTVLVIAVGAALFSSSSSVAKTPARRSDAGDVGSTTASTAATTGVATRSCAHERIVAGFPTYAEYLKQYGKGYGSQAEWDAAHAAYVRNIKDIAENQRE